uniref:Uncharacterized protein n=1 Tax=Avena sativa TaxID=4498 RepID=A0ACD5UMJ2_AVESA
MATTGSGGEPGRPWTATSTWAPARGAAVEDAVSFETTEVDAETSPSAVVLDRPPSDDGADPTPCEVTFNFTGKYEIHRVYVRSTARIYEIYYSTDLKDTSKDYLCTVRCGIAAQEPLPSGEECMSQGSSNAATGEKHEQETKSLTSSSDEDSWVEVKIPESPLGNTTPVSQERNVIGSCQKNTLVHYEATAEITDANPCISITVRLLSLQSKSSVYIDEIYIYADPVDTTSDDPVADPGNMGGSSLLAMLVPSLMQISKPRDCKIDDKYFSDGLKDRLPEGCTPKDNTPCGNIAQEAGLYGANGSKFNLAGLESRLPPPCSGTIYDENDNQREFLLNDHRPPPFPVQTTENIPVTSAKDKTVSNTHQDASPVMRENVTPHNRIEGMLDTLLSKMDKVELYCSRFEEKMLKPLGGIEARLQRLEQQFESFSGEIQSLRGSSARMSAPNVLSDTTNSQEKEHNDSNSGTPASVADRQPGLVIKAPEFSLEDSCSFDVADANTVNLCVPNVMPRLFVKAPDFIYEPELTCEKLHHGPLPSEKERKTSPGLVINVPEFVSDEEDEVEEDKEVEAGDLDAHTNSYDTVSKSTDDSFRGKTPVSVDGTLASALEAFLTSTKGTSFSKSVACPVSNLSGGNFADSSSSSFPREHDEISTKDGSVGLFHPALVDTNKVGTAISFQEVDVAPHIFLSKANLVGNLEVNEQNIDLYPDKKAFASIKPLDVPSQSHTGTLDDPSQANGQNNGPNSDMMPLVTSTEPVDDPSQLPTHLGSAGEIAQVNQSRPSLPLAEFLAARRASSFRNGTSEVCCSNDGAAVPSFQRTLAAVYKNLEGGDSKASQKNPTSFQTLLKEALEVDVGFRNLCDDISTETTFEPSRYAASADGANRHGTSTTDTLSDEDGGLEHREDNISISGGMNSFFFELSDSKERWNENSNLCSGPNESFRKPNVEHLWSDLTSMESFGGLSSREVISSGNAVTGNLVADLLVGNGGVSNVTPIEGAQLQKVYDLLNECENDILGMAFVGERTSTSSPSLQVLLGESSDSEAQISDMEDVKNDAGFDSDHLFATFSSSDDDAFAIDRPSVDVANASAGNEPLVDVVDLTNPSWTYTPSVDKPLADVADVAEPANLYASAADEFLFSDLPKTSETFVGGSSGEHPDSLI